MIEPRNLVPSPRHAQLLRAALHVDAAVAQRSIEAWQSAVRIDDLDATSVRLLSLLADRIDELDVEPAVRERVATIVRFSWLRTQALLAACRPVLSDLAGGPTPFLLLKGAALLGAGAAGLGRRQLDDVDLLVPAAAVPLIVGTLRARGFDNRLAEGLIARPRQYLAATHSTAFVRGQAEIDLHWRAAPLARRPEVEERRWFDARHVDVAGIPVGVPSATEMLLLAIEHDAVPVPAGSGRWVGDARALIGTGEVDAARLAARASELGLRPVLDQAAWLYPDLTGQSFPVPARAGRGGRSRLAGRPSRDPRAVEALELWQRRRAQAEPGWRGTVAAAASTWTDLGGVRALRAVPAPVPTAPASTGGGDAPDPWAWGCRPVDLRFGVNDDGLGWLRTGWSSPEPGFTWSDGPSASVLLPTDVAPGEPLVIDVVSHGLVTDQAGPYEVVWSADGTPVAVQHVTDGGQAWTTIDVPADTVRGGTVALTADIRWPRSAVEAGTGTDLRRLGVGLAWIRVTSGWSPRAPEEGPSQAPC